MENTGKRLHTGLSCVGLARNQQLLGRHPCEACGHLFPPLKLTRSLRLDCGCVGEGQGQWGGGISLKGRGPISREKAFHNSLLSTCCVKMRGKPRDNMYIHKQLDTKAD